MLEPIVPPSPMIGSTVAVVLMALMMFAMLALPGMRVLTMVLRAMRWLTGSASGLLRRRAVATDPTRPLMVDGLSSSLARFTRQTRTLALELRRCTGEAETWPAEASSSAQPRSSWRESMFGGDGAPPVGEVRREVFEWLRTAETLPHSDREALSRCGVDLEQVRRSLTEDAGAADVVVRSLAGLLWGIDERLAGANPAGYRDNGAGQATQTVGAGPLLGAANEDDDRARRGRWTAALADHGRGLSRMAGSYSKSAAEREDLEQDIALALWRALPTFRGESTLKTFAYKVARYCCFRHVRGRKDLEDPADPQTVADPTPGIETALLHADQRARIEQALTDLPGNLESVVTMHLTGHSYAQIAEALGITEANVSVRLTRARARLRRQLVAA